MTRSAPILIVASLLAACQKEPAPPPPPRPALTQVVAAQTRPGQAVYAGEVRARYENDVGFRVPGKVVSRHVEVGSTVRRGAVLARLDPQDARLQVEGTKAQRAAAEADLTLARAELERYRSLRAQNFVAQAVLDAKQNAFNAAEARVDQTRAQQDIAQNSAAYTTLVAERDGVITAVNIEPGQVVAAGQPAFRIARPEEKEVVVSVAENRLAEWKTASGMAVQLWTAPGRTFRARVREVAPNADAVTRTFNVKISILDADDAVRLGMTANVSLAGPADSTIVVPMNALGDQAGTPVVWVVDPQTSNVERRAVKVGTYREDGATILDGLQGGERIGYDRGRDLTMRVHGPDFRNILRQAWRPRIRARVAVTIDLLQHAFHKPRVQPPAMVARIAWIDCEPLDQCLVAG